MIRQGGHSRLSSGQPRMAVLPPGQEKAKAGRCRGPHPLVEKEDTAGRDDMGRKPNLDRHRQVAKLRAQGLTHAEIARRLGISRQTVQRAIEQAPSSPSSGSRKTTARREAPKRPKEQKTVQDERNLVR